MPDAHDQHDDRPSPAPPGAPQTAPPSDSKELLAAVYEELRSVAASYLQRESPGHTLQPTALVHEAWVRLAELDRIRWRDRTHFFVAASGAIRRVLVDHARSRSAAKRGGGRRRFTLDDADGVADSGVIDLLALDEALGRLDANSPRKRKVVELRFFGGLTVQETAKALGVGTTTVEDDWAFARAWLKRELSGDASAGPGGAT